MPANVRPIVWAMTLLPMLTAAAANARPCPPVAFGAPQQSLDLAAVGTLRTLVLAGHLYESGGFVIEQDGEFRASKPVTQRSRREVNYCIAVPSGATLVGIYHTHVFNPAFSPRDRQNAERMSVPSYIGTLDAGRLFVYDPAAGRARAIGKLVVGGDPDSPPESSPFDWAAWADQLTAWAEHLTALTEWLWGWLGRSG